jgi:hypothetical protein
MVREWFENYPSGEWFFKNTCSVMMEQVFLPCTPAGVQAVGIQIEVPARRLKTLVR